jgi:hypothetical protein
MKLMTYILFFFVCFRYVISQTLFCSTLCNVGQCIGKAYNNCRTCTNGFIKVNPFNFADACIVNPAISNSTG